MSQLEAIKNAQNLSKHEDRLLDPEIVGFAVEQRATDGGNLTVLMGTGVVFGALSKPLTLILESGEAVEFREIIEPGAFDGCNMTDVICCIDHEEGKLLGRIPNTLRLMIDRVGVRYECDLPPLQIASDLLVYIDRKDIRGNSFRFVADKEFDVWERLSDGTIIRHIHKIKRLIDIGPVVRPAYPQTHVAARSYQEYLTQAETGTPTLVTNQAEQRARQIRANARRVAMLRQ